MNKWRWSINPSLNKTNLRDLIAATGPVILLKLDSNRRFFSPCALEIWWMTRKIIEHLFDTTLSFVHHFKSISEFKLELQSGNTQCGSKLTIFVPCDLEIWRMTLKINKAPLQCYCKLFAPLMDSNWNYSPEAPNLGKIRRFIFPMWPCNLTYVLKKQ